MFEIQARYGGERMPIKIMLAFSNLLFSEGIAKLLENDKELSIYISRGNNNQVKKRIESIKPDVILADIITLYNTFSDIKGTQKLSFILLDTGCGEENIVSTFVSRGLAGILLCDTNTALLKKAIKGVARGEIWIDNKTVKNLLNGFNALKERDSRYKLSEREKEIIHLISLGCRNKEIASKLYISDATVKTHLYRIFQKLDIQNRHQLVVFALQNQFTVK